MHQCRSEKNGQGAPVRGLHVPSHVPSHTQTAAKVRGFSPIASGFTAETDWLLEQSGFEPSVPLLRKGPPGVAEGRSRNDWLGSRIKLWSSREMAIGCAPSPRPVHGESEIFESRLLRQRARTFATARSGRHRSSNQPSCRSASIIALPIPNQAGNRERGGAGNSDAGEQAQHQPPIALLRLPPRI